MLPPPPRTPHTALEERDARGQCEEQHSAAAAAPASKAAAQSANTADSSSSVLASVMPLTKLEVTLLEVAKAHLRDGFFIAQPTLTRALKSIFVMKFGAADWLAHLKTYLGRSMAEHAVDDGRAFDM